MLTKLKPYSGSYDNFGVFDIETSERSAKDFKFGVTILGSEIKTFFSKDEMRNFLLDKNHVGIRWYAHNAEYDLSSLFDNILTIPNSSLLMNGGRFIELKINILPEKSKRKQQKYIRFWDTFNLIPMSLSKIGKIFNLPKLKYSKNEIESNSDIAIKYCVRDCEITKLLIEKYNSYCQKFSISPRLTTSSTAMSIFRTQFLEKNKWIDDNDIFFKNSYVGGRTEVFTKSMKNGYHYDINSLYPSAMKKDFYPDFSKIRKGNPDNFQFHLDNFEGVACIKVYAPDMYIPVLPYRKDGKIIYPVGCFEGWYNFNEIRFAIQRGYKILEVKEYYFAERIESPFKAYIDFWFEQKQKSKNDAGFYDFCKRMMNGLYGKFGEYHDNKVWQNISYDPRTKEEKDNDLDIFDLYIFDEVKNSGFGNWIKKGQSIKEQITEHTIFSLCSYVTSYARMILYEELEKSGLKNCYYVDTDSKFTTEFQESSNELGEMKLEHSNINCFFQAPKMYEISSIIDCRDYIYYAIELSVHKNEYKLKGVKLGNKNIFQKSYTQKRVLKSREALRRGLTSGDWITVIKEPSGVDTKRIWNKDGSSLPIRI